MKRFFAALLLVPCLALAQSFPTKAVRIIVPFPPGGGTDVVARILGQKLTETWGQQAIIENKAGASGSVGSDLVAKAHADGYTLLLQGTQHAINLSLYKKLPYDTLKDFVPIAYLALAPFLLIVNAAVPVNSVTELIAYIKTQPNGLDYGSSGPGGGAHLRAHQSGPGIDRFARRRGSAGGGFRRARARDAQADTGQILRTSVFHD